MKLKGILLDQPSPAFLKLAEDCVDKYAEPEFVPKPFEDKPIEIDNDQQFHSYMNPRFHLNDNHHNNIKALLQERDSLLAKEIKAVEKQRKDQSDASRATILALESKLKSSK